jgi:3'(2'), 5'-bisphosphate nucleotidase
MPTGETRTGGIKPGEGLAASARREIARRLADYAAEAGDILNCYRNAACLNSLKPDGSPVSEADLAAEATILARLLADYPQWPVISEENAASHGSAPAGGFFLVDPLDGTKAFLAGGPDFCVLIALVLGGVPVASAIHAPATGQSWWASGDACEADGAFKAYDRGFVRVEPLQPSPRREGDPVAIISSQHAGEKSRVLCDTLRVSKVLCENSALKFARLAEGEADVYPRIGRTMQWDIAAGDGLLRSLGGGVLDMEGRPLRYGAHAAGWDNPDFIAWRTAPCSSTPS